MKKRLAVIAAVVVGALIITGFVHSGEFDSSYRTVYYNETLERLAGTWECEENPLNDPENYTGYIMMNIDDKGGFRIYDGETGKDFLRGILTVSDSRYLVLLCEDGSKFNPPNTWSSMNNVELIRYKFKSEEKLYLTYEEDKRTRSTLIFSKGIKE